MGEVPRWVAILTPILFWGGIILYAGGIRGFFEDLRDQYREWGLKGTILFLLAFAAWVVFMTWITP
ncbi:hypothetical protein KGY72_07060 [Candidatus Bipolaricaulota bacterium]|nr:hypothetical protein [Candidatus Bipolaricaulota bacterium]